MPLVLTKDPALLSLQPLSQEVEANQPPVINTYGPEIEKWRRQVWDQMPPQLKQRPDAATLLDKALYVINGESGGNDSAVGDNGAAWGLAQSHHIPAGSDSTTQINNMWSLVSNNPDQWTDWGEGTTYQGKVFGALGNKPYNGSNPSLWSRTQDVISGNRPVLPGQQKAISTYQDAYSNSTSDIGKEVLSNALKNAGSPIDPSTGGVYNPNYDITQPQDQSPYVDESAKGTLRGDLEARREGKDQLGNAALAGAVALPLIGAGPVSTVLGTVGGEIGNQVDKRLGIDNSLNLPILGKTGPLQLIGGAIGGSKGEEAFAPETAPGRPWTNVVKPPRPNLRVVQPDETPGVLSVTGKGKPNPQEFIAKARAMGMSDDEIRQAFPGALEAASGIDTGPQVAARTDAEQLAKGAAAKRTYERIFAQHVEDLKAEGYTDAEAKQIATGLASREARRAAAQAPENLPGQKPNTLYDPEAATQMEQASQRIRNPGSAVTEPAPGVPYDKPADALSAEADKLSRIGGTARSSTDQTIADVATGAKRLGDPASEIRRQLQGQGKSQLKQAIEDEEQKRGKRRTPEENAALKAARTAGPENPPQTLQDVLEADKAKFTPPVDNPNAGQLELGGQGGQMGTSEAGPTGGSLTDRSQTQYPKFDAASVAERARLSAEYIKNNGGPQLTEAEFKSQWNNVKTARDGGRRWPENWTQEKINAYQKLEQGLTGQANPSAVGQDVSGGLLPGPLFEEGANVPPSVRPPEGQTLGQQRLNRGLEDQTKLPGEGDVVTDYRNLKPDQQATLLNKDWEPGKSIAETAARGIADLVSLPRSLQTRFDFSYPFRQGLLFVRRQKEFWDAFGTGLQSSWKDEDWKRAVEAEYTNAPFNPRTLKITKWDGGNMATREEMFYNRLIDKFPAPMRKVFDASEEAATIFINKLRSDVTNNVARKWIREGLSPNDPEFIQDLNIFGNYVNRATGYGNLGELEKSVGLLNTVFYGARRNVAMIQAPGYLFNSSARVRVEAWKDFLGLVGMGSTTLGLAQLAGIGDVNTFNPKSADWGKLKIGDTRIDIWGGYQQTARLVYELASGQIKDPGDFADVWQKMLPYLGNKLSPQATAAVSTMPAGIRKPIQPVDRPFKLTDALAPLAWQGLVQAVREDGALAGAFAATGLAGVGSQTYESQTDVRNKESQAQYGTNYENLGKAQQAAVDKSERVTKYQQENPSDYKQTKDRLLTPIDQQEQQAEQAFRDNKLSKPLPDIWHEQGIQRQQVAKDLGDQFSGMFEGFDKSRYDKAVEGYYGKQVTGPDGQLDFDATESARQDYIKTLKPDEQQWLDEALQVSKESKSDAHQKYLKYIDERKKAGYFDVKVDDPDRAKKLIELDRKNPLQDALNWYWKGGTQDTNRVPALNSPDAVAYALQLAPNRPVTYAGLGRPLNQTPQTLQMWQDYGTRIQNYYTKTVPAYQDQVAQDMFGVKFDQLPDRQSRERVVSNILTQVRRGSPELEAILQYLGDSADQNGDFVVSAEAEPYLRQFIAKYGAQPVKSVNASGRPSKFLVRN